MKLGIKLPLVFGTILLVISVSISVTSISISSSILGQTLLDAMEVETDANADIISERMGRQLDVLFEIANSNTIRSMNWELVQPSLLPDIPRINSLEMGMEVIVESKNLEKATAEITSGMNEMASGADQINTAVNHVNEISRQNSDVIKNLAKEVSRFKVA